MTVSATDAAGLVSARTQSLVVPGVEKTESGAPGGGGSGGPGPAGTGPRAVPRVKLTYTPNQRAGSKPKGGGGAGKNAARYTFRFVDPSGGSSFRCSLDGSPFRPCSSPKVYGHLRPGRHVFRVRALAPDGEASPTRTIHFLAGRRP